MNKKGFTLVEVLGVMVIIVTLSLIILPNIINRFSNKKEDISSTNKEILVSAAKLYVSDKKEELSDYLTYCVDINELIKNKYLSEKKDVFSDNDYASNHKVKVTIGKPNEYEVVESGSCKSLTPYDTGNKIKVAGIDFYIVSNHDDYVVALKANPLTVTEINTYGGVGTENNHVNMYVLDFTDYYQRAYGCLNGQYYVYDYDYDDPRNDQSYCRREYDWGIMAYYESETCNEDKDLDSTGCTTDYIQSEIKYVVDNWYEDKFINNELKEIDGYKARLIKKEELVNYFGCETKKCSISLPSSDFWTMSGYNNSDEHVWAIKLGRLSYASIYQSGDSRDTGGRVLPVINVYKSAIQFD